MSIADVLFLPWPLWAKLGFVLGSLLMICTCAGFVTKFVLWGKKKRIKRRLGQEEAERGEVELTTPIDNDTLFGIKSMDDEAEIEGLWNAQTLTALHIPPGLIRDSSPSLRPRKKLSKSQRASSISAVTPLDMEGPDQAEAQIGLPIPLPDPAPAQPEPDQPKSMRPETTRRRKSNSITISYSGPSTRTKDVGDQTAQSNPAQPPLRSQSSKLRISPSRTRRNSTKRKFVIGERADTHQGTLTVPSQHQDVIESMNAHRRKHSAESGQLKPRIQRHTTEEPRSNDSRLEGSAYETASRTSSWPQRDSDLRLGNNATQKAERRVSPCAVPFRASIEMLPSSKPPPSAWTNRTRDMMEAKLSEHIPAAAELMPTTPSMCSLTTVSDITEATQPVSIANTKTRKVNDGFELLPAGTFDQDFAVSAPGTWPAPLRENSNKSKQRKLQKRARSISVSSRSSNEGRRSMDSGKFMPSVF